MQKNILGHEKTYTLINNLDLEPVLKNKIRQVRWLYNNSNKCAKVYDEKLVRLIVHKLKERIGELELILQPKFYEPSQHPTRVEGEDFSVDVFILDEEGVHGIAFWNFDDKVWRFHTDTLVDYNEPNAETKWKWYYPPFGIDQVFNSENLSKQP